jgi:hypothetical protein
MTMQQRQKTLAALFFLAVVPVSITADEFLFKGTLSEAFIPDTNAITAYNIWFGAITNFALGNYIIQDGERHTYVDNILVVESKAGANTAYKFGLKFASEGDAFKFFVDVRSQLSIYVPVQINQTIFGAIFADGVITSELSGMNVFFIFGLF